MVCYIYQRKDGRFEGRLKLGKAVDGKIIYRYVYAKTKEICLEKLDLLQQNIKTKTLPRAVSSLTFSKICTRWLEFIRSYAKPSTISVYTYNLQRYLLPAFADYSLNDLTENKLQSFVTGLLKGTTDFKSTPLAPATVKNITVIIKNILNFAEKRLHIISPAKHIRVGRSAGREQFMPDNDWNIIKQAVQNDYTIAASAIDIAVNTGLRIGELCALKRQDIQLENGLIYIQRTVQRIMTPDGINRTSLILGEPKSTSSKRFIPIPDILMERFRFLCAGKRADEFLLSSDGKKILEPRTLQYQFKKYLEKLSVVPVNFHRLRHKFAGSCIEKQFDIKALSEILGHSSINITLNYYVHPTMDFKRKQMNLLSVL